MKIISWNVNGLKSIIKNGFEEIVENLNPDIICLQETKISHDIDLELKGYSRYYNYCKRPGYSGVAILTKEKPIKVLIGMEIEN